MKHNVFACVCTCLILAGFSPLARAEALDDASIRKIYADNAAAINDPEKIRQLLQKELADDFLAQIQETEIINSHPSKTDLETDDKGQMIASTVESIKGIEKLKYDYRVVAITYSSDHKSAYVTKTITYSGIKTSPSPVGEIVIGHIDDDQECTDQITLDGMALKILMSTCTEKMNMKK